MGGTLRILAFGTLALARRALRRVGEALRPVTQAFERVLRPVAAVMGPPAAWTWSVTRPLLLRATAPIRRPVRKMLDYEFRDCRVILEQDDHVRYLVLTANLQRRVAQISAGSLAATFLLVLGMALYGAMVTYNNNRLEHSHEEIYRALLETYDGVEGQAGAPTEEQMLAIAASIRQRNNEIERFVDRSLASISGENTQLADALHESGLTGKIVHIIQQSTPVGGFNGDSVPHSNLAQVNDLASAMAHNQQLRDVLGALPDHLPLDSPRISSNFGLRVHPITGNPQFHSGVDLIPTGDLLIRPVMRGKVALASFGKELGNVVVIRHGSGVETLYGHMASIAVQTGDEVTENTVIGVVGNTGSATTGRHLHFEVTVGGYPVNPLKVIQTAQNVRKIEAQY
jgi:murein DD-endopeptidase MepM/ murein hydrolase activator NlpD